MSGEEKNKLDELFKHGMDNPMRYRDYDERDWDQLESMLDGKKGRGRILWLPYWGAAAAVILLLLGWWFIKPENTQREKMSVNKHKTAPDLIKPQNAGPGTIVPALPGTREQTAPSYAVRKTMGKGAAKNTATGKGDTFAKPAQPQADGNLLAIVPAGTKQDEPAKTPGNAGTAITNQQPAQPATPDMAGNLSAKSNTLAANAKPSDKTVKSINRPRSTKLALSVLLSPDINGAGTFRQAKVGTNAGLILTIGFGQKLSLSTGMVYSKKPYLTDFDNYHTTYHFKNDPVDVYADCRVLDIPLNIGYKFYSKNKNSFSIGSGLSSYIMLKEKYSYQYSSAYAYGPAGYTITNRNRHILGVLNLNTTYQRDLTNKFSIAVQPYLKIPLTNIGYSQVRLQSAGVAVGLSWNINPVKP